MAMRCGNALGLQKPCDHLNKQRYCDRCMPSTMKVLALKNVFIENLFVDNYLDERKSTIDERRAFVRNLVNELLLVHEAIILKPYNDARERAQAAKERNYKRKK